MENLDFLEVLKYFVLFGASTTALYFAVKSKKQN